MEARNGTNNVKHVHHRKFDLSRPESQSYFMPYLTQGWPIC